MARPAFHRRFAKEQGFMAFTGSLLVRLNKTTDQPHPGSSEIWRNNMRCVSTSLLNQVVRDAVGINPPPSDRGRKLKIFYATQAAVRSPTIVFFVNDAELMHFSYLRFWRTDFRIFRVRRDSTKNGRQATADGGLLCCWQASSWAVT